MGRLIFHLSCHHHAHGLAQQAFAGFVFTGDGELEVGSDRKALKGLLLEETQ